MARSELLASACAPLWELRTGRRPELPEWFSRFEPDVAASPLVERIIDRLDAFAARWHELPPGDSITLEWSPATTTVAASLLGAELHIDDRLCARTPCVSTKRLGRKRSTPPPSPPARKDGCGSGRCPNG
jgi:hypothetical protein